MKNIVVLLTILFITLNSFGQSPIKFVANEKSSIILGDTWDYEFTSLKTPISVNFDGKVLKLTYTDGKEWGSYDIISFEKKENTSDGEVDKETYILLTKYRNYYQYIIIEKDFKIRKLDNGIIYTIKIPFLSKISETISYEIFRQF